MINYSRWMALPLGTRIKIAQQFGIAKLRPTHVSDNKILDDGYNIADVESQLNVFAMQEYLGSVETDVPTLFQMVVDKMEVKEVKIEEPIQTIDSVSAPTAYIVVDEPKPKKKVSKKK